MHMVGRVQSGGNHPDPAGLLAGAAVSQWLGLRLQMLAATVTGLVAVAAVLQKNGLLPGSHTTTGTFHLDLLTFLTGMKLIRLGTRLA